MTGKTTAITAAMCAVLGFGGGFWPQFQGRKDAESRLAAVTRDLEAAKGQLEGATASVRLSSLLGQALALRDLLAAQNYGLAQQQATHFFDAVAKEGGRAPAGSLTAAALTAVQALRDRVTAGTSTADPGTALVVREIEARLRGALGYSVPEVPATAAATATPASGQPGPAAPVVP